MRQRVPDGRLIGGRQAGVNLRANRSSDVPSMTAGRAVLVLSMNHYIRVLLDPFITLLELHKLMYFAQFSGEPLRLKFVKGKYGPYAQNLRHVLNAMEGHLISGYFDGGDSPGKPLELVPGAVEDAEAFLSSRGDTRTRLGRVLSLVEGFESSYGLELLATVHWAINQDHPRDFGDLAKCIYGWDSKKRRFTPRQLKIAVERLSEGGWIGELAM